VYAIYLYAFAVALILTSKISYISVGAG